MTAETRGMIDEGVGKTGAAETVIGILIVGTAIEIGTGGRGMTMGIGGGGERLKYKAVCTPFVFLGYYSVS